MNDSLRVEKFKRLRDPEEIRPQQASIAREPRSRKQSRLRCRASESFERIAEAGVQDNVKAFMIRSAGQHWDEQLIRSGDGGKTLKLAYLAAPDVFYVAIIGHIWMGPELYQHGSAIGSPRPKKSRLSAGGVRTNQIYVVLMIAF